MAALSRSRISVVACFLIGLGLSISSSAAQELWPTRPIQIIVPYAAGGSIDITMRVIAPSLSKNLGQSVVVLDRPGGGGTIGMNEVAVSRPDGYTLGAASFSFAANPTVIAHVPYDALKDFVPITQVASSPTLILVNPKYSPAKTVQEFIDWVKSKPPGSMNYGSAGVGSSGHLFTELFLLKTGLKMVHIPFTNGGREPLSQGQTQLQVAPIPSAMPFVSSNSLLALGVTSLHSNPSLPGIEPVSKTVPGFEVFEWPALVAPAGTSQAIVDRIQKAVVLTLKEPDVLEKLAKLGSQPVGSTPEEFHAFLEQQVELWAKLGKQIGLQPK